MRCDVNVSVRPHGQEAFGTKVEIKNMNTFGGMQKAIDYEIDRQVMVYTFSPRTSKRSVSTASVLEGDLVLQAP